MNQKQADRIAGRRIVRVDMRGHWADNGIGRVRMHDPVIVLDDGTELVFLVEEHPEGFEYGVDVVRRMATPKAAPR